MEELIDVLDENGVKTGEILTRKEIHKRGLWHRAIAVAVINEQNQILVQQRSFKKEKNTGMWDISVAGHISSGQDALSAASREINEEISVNLGFNVDIKEFRYMFSYRKEEILKENYIERQFYDFFILRKNGLRTEDIKVQESEVEQIKFVSVSELNEMIENKEIVERTPIYKELMNYIFRI
ncbi:MAG: NUDIX hydrolase [Clostridia bacterium]|jgi:isopentenyl-diphosphate delta-isomerase|nr:NUDIX domain-containing protein [Clostridium sp.]MEE0269343.1 NUDIX domain-containing protein [Clostridia bacterium]